MADQPKFCRDCRHATRTFFPRLGDWKCWPVFGAPSFAECKVSVHAYVSRVSPIVTIEREYCNTYRLPSQQCGPDAKLFEARP